MSNYSLLVWRKKSVQFRIVTEITIHCCSSGMQKMSESISRWDKWKPRPWKMPQNPDVDWRTIEATALRTCSRWVIKKQNGEDERAHEILINARELCGEWVKEQEVYSYANARAVIYHCLQCEGAVSRPPLTKTRCQHCLKPLQVLSGHCLRLTYHSSCNNFNRVIIIRYLIYELAN